MNKNCLIWVFVLVLACVSCSKTASYKKKLNVPYQNMEPKEVQIVEFYNTFFAIDTANFDDEYQALLPDNYQILDSDPDEETKKYMKEFISDTFMLRVLDMVNEAFYDIKTVDEEVRDVYQHYRYYYPDTQVLKTFAVVSGIYYNRPISIGEDHVEISFDFYLSNKDLVYDKIGIPRYMSRRMQPFSLTRDLAEEFYYHTYGNRINQKTVLAEMIEQGKMYYFIEAMNPSMPDSVILGYTAYQTDWAHFNEGQVWAAVVGNNMLYVNDLKQKRMMFGDGPFTSAFGNDSPARLGDYLGLQIIRSFMSNNDVPLVELMKMTDYQDILHGSQYKPRK